MKKILFALITFIIIVATILIVIQYCHKDKYFLDTELKEKPYSIADCVNFSKELLNLDSSVHLSDISIFYNDITEQDVKVNIVFVDIKKYNPITPYIVYNITVDVKSGKATNISRKYHEYVIYDDLEISEWNLDLDNAVTNSQIVDFISINDINLSKLVITTTNYAWDYIFNDGIEKEQHILLNPVSLDIVNN